MKNYSTTTMLAKITRSTLALAGAALLILGQSAHATDWTGNNNTNWNNAGNWTAGKPNGTTDSIGFGASNNYTSNNNFTTPSPFTVNNVSFSINAGQSYLITGSAFNVAGTIANASDYTDTITTNPGALINLTGADSPAHPNTLSTATATGSLVITNGVALSSGAAQTLVISTQNGSQVVVGNGASTLALVLSGASQIPVTSTITGDGLFLVNGIVADQAVGHPGALTYSGTGTMVLLGNNTFTGSFTLTSGTVEALNDVQAFSTGTVTLAGGNLDLNNNTTFSTYVNDVVVTAPNAAPATITLDSGSGSAVFNQFGALTVAAGDSVNIVGGASITSGGGVLNFTGTATFTGGGTSTISIEDPVAPDTSTVVVLGPLSTAAGTTIAVNSTSTGTLNLGSSASSIGAGTTVAIGTGATVILDASNALSDAPGAAETLVTQNPGGTLEVDSNNTLLGLSNNIANTGFLNINNSIFNNTTLTITNSTDDTYTGAISGNGNLTLNGTAAFTLGGNSLGNAGFSGTVTLGNTVPNGGIVNLNSNEVTGTGSLVLNGGVTIDNTSGSSVTLDNGFTTVTGDIAYGGTDSLTLNTGGITLTSTATAITVTNDSTTHHTLTLDGSITSSGTTGLTIASTGDGRTVIGGDIATTGSFTNTGSGATIVLGSIDSTVGTGTVTTGSFTSVTENGSSVLVLVGDNAYTGGTDIISGTIVAANTSALGVNSAVTLATNGTSPATLELHRSISIGSLFDGAADLATTTDVVNLGSHTLTIGGDGTSPGAFGGTIEGTGSIDKVGVGVLTLNGASSTYSGGTTLTEGTIELGASTQFVGDARTTDIASGPLGTGTLVVANNANLTTDGLGSGAYPGIQLANNIELAGSQLLVTPSGTTGLWLSGVISQSGTLDISGTSTVYLTGRDQSPSVVTPTYSGNTYTGDTNLDGGTVIIGTNADAGTSTPQAITPFGTGTVYVNGATILTTDANTAASAIFTNAYETFNSYIIANNFVLSPPMTVLVPEDTSLTMTGAITGGPNDNLNVGVEGSPTIGGTLILTPSGTVNTYSGNTDIAANNTLAAGNSSLSSAGGGTSANSAFIVNGVLDLADSAIINVPTTFTIASLSGTTGVVDIGAGNSLQTGGNNATTTYSGVFTGSGSLIKNGNGLMILSGESLDYSGSVVINHGSSPTSPGGIVVENEYALGGGDGNVTNNAILASGAAADLTNNAVTIRVGDGYVQSSTGTLALEVVGPQYYKSAIAAGDAYDTLSAGNTAAINGGKIYLDLSRPGVQDAAGEAFQVVSATGTNVTTNDLDPVAVTVTGTTNTKLTPITVYNDSFGGAFSPNSVVVVLAQPFNTFSGLTPNQTAVATGVDNAILNFLAPNHVLLNPTGTNLDFFNNIAGGLYQAADGGFLGQALDQLSPQRFEILRNIAYDNNAFDVQTLDDEFARERNGPGGFDTSGFAFNDSRLGALSGIKSRLLAWSPQSDPGLLSDSSQNMLSGVTMADPKDVKNMTAATGVYSKWNGFIDGGADLGNIDSNADISSQSYTTGRIRIGGDYAVTSNLRVGLLFGYSHTNADLDNEGSKAKVNSYTPGIFVTYADKSGFFANGIFTAGVNDYTTDRNIQIPGVSRTATATSNGVQFNGDLDGGYEFHKGDWTFGPSAGLTYVNMGINSFTEGGAGSADLAVNSQSSDSLRSRVGGAISYAAKIGSVNLTPHIDAFWQHEFLDNSGNINSSFAGLPGSGFSVSTTAGDKNNALVGAGLDADLSQHLTLFIDYQAEAGGSTFFGQSISGGAKVAF